jgi:flagellar basal-body rod modification protein FlgD
MTSIASQNAAFLAARENGSATAGSKTSATASQSQFNDDLNFFLTMLTTQLKNQDPTSPLDTNEFTQQIAQYSSVQQQVITNDNLEKLIASNRQSEVTTAVGYIGKEIETAGNTGVVAGGQGAFSYILPRKADTVELTIKDAAGQVVFRGAGASAEGRNLVVWDGKNSSNGRNEPDGTYTLTVVAKDASDKLISAETRAVAVVSGVETGKAGNAELTTAFGKVAFDKILAVREPTRANLGV